MKVLRRTILPFFAVILLSSCKKDSGEEYQFYIAPPAIPGQWRKIAPKYRDYTAQA